MKVSYSGRITFGNECDHTIPESRSNFFSEKSCQDSESASLWSAKMELSDPNEAELALSSGAVCVLQTQSDAPHVFDKMDVGTKTLRKEDSKKREETSEVAKPKFPELNASDSSAMTLGETGEVYIRSIKLEPMIKEVDICISRGDKLRKGWKKSMFPKSWMFKFKKRLEHSQEKETYILLVSEVNEWIQKSTAEKYNRGAANVFAISVDMVEEIMMKKQIKCIKTWMFKFKMQRPNHIIIGAALPVIDRRRNLSYYLSASAKKEMVKRTSVFQRPGTLQQTDKSSVRFKMRRGLFATVQMTSTLSIYDVHKTESEKSPESLMGVTQKVTSDGGFAVRLNRCSCADMVSLEERMLIASMLFLVHSVKETVGMYHTLTDSRTSFATLSSCIGSDVLDAYQEDEVYILTGREMSVLISARTKGKHYVYTLSVPMLLTVRSRRKQKKKHKTWKFRYKGK